MKGKYKNKKANAAAEAERRAAAEATAEAAAEAEVAVETGAGETDAETDARARKAWSARETRRVIAVAALFLFSVATVFFLVTSVRFFWFRPITVTGKSMIPTLEPNSLHYVDTTARPEVGDIAVFYYVPDGDATAKPSVDYYGANAYFRSMPIFGSSIEETYSGGYTMMVKRVVAVGGDRVALRPETIDGVNFIFLYRNGEKVEEDIVMLNRDALDEATRAYAEALTAERGPEATQGVAAMDEVTVADGCYYVLGDNRDGSKDSRTIGAVSRGYFVGTLR